MMMFFTGIIDFVASTMALPMDNNSYSYDQGVDLHDHEDRGKGFTVSNGIGMESS
jgi:hypothetical protein